MRQPPGFGAAALIALCVVEIVSLITIVVAAITAPLVPAPDERSAADRPDGTKRHRRSFDRSCVEPERLAR